MKNKEIAIKYLKSRMRYLLRKSHDSDDYTDHVGYWNKAGAIQSVLYDIEHK